MAVTVALADSDFNGPLLPLGKRDEGEHDAGDAEKGH